MTRTNPTAFSPELRTLWFASPLTGKMAAVGIIFCIMLNCFVPRFSLSAHNQDIIAQILSSQSSLLQFFSLSTVPLKIVGSIFENSRTLPCSAGTKLPGTDDEGRCADSSTDYSVCACGKRSAAPQFGIGHQSDIAGRVSLQTALFQGNMGKGQAGPVAHTITCPAVVRFVFLLPRSTIGDDEAVIRDRASNTAQL
jgi:hypothetical protein